MNNPDQQNNEADSLEEMLKHDVAFFANPSPCGSHISFRISDEDKGLVGTSFLFDSSDVQTVSADMFKESPRMTGAELTAKWTSLCNPDIDSPTPVPALPSINLLFPQIAFKLIASGKGQATCPLCDQTFEANRLAAGKCRTGGYFYETYACPNQHELIRSLVMHVLLRR